MNPHIISCYLNINWRGKHWIRFTDVTVCTTHYWSMRHQSAQGKKRPKKKCWLCFVLCIIRIRTSQQPQFVHSHICGHASCKHVPSTGALWCSALVHHPHPDLPEATCITATCSPTRCGECKILWSVIDSLPCITWLMTGNVKTLLSKLLWNMWYNTLFLAPGCSTLTLLDFLTLTMWFINTKHANLIHNCYIYHSFYIFQNPVAITIATVYHIL